MEMKCTNSDEMLEVLLRDVLIEKLNSESKKLLAEAETHNFTDKFSHFVKKARRSVGSEENRMIVLKLTIRSLISVTCVLGIMFCIFLTQPTVNAAVNDVIRRVFTGYDDYTFQDQAIPGYNAEIRLGYVPKDYELRTVYYSEPSIYVTYEDYNGNTIYFEYGLSTEGVALSIDTDNHNYSSFVKNGIEYHYYEGHSEADGNILMWTNDGYYFVLDAQLDKDSLMQISENLK